MKSNLARAGKVDVRRDEEQNVKLSEILKLLLNAGYHRARIKGLAPFDKIIGGMTWCIEVCNFDIDVDLLFHDSLTIGQKIALTEKIVKVLPRMKCPHGIEPHQIQGLDSIHILPVIQWLVKLAIATRAQYRDETKDIAIDEFNRNYCRPVVKNDYSVNKFHSIKLRYGPRRTYRRDGLSRDQTEKVITTLYEYAQEEDDLQIFVDSEEECEEEQDKELLAKVEKEMILDSSTDVLFSDRSEAKTRQELMMLEDFGSIEETIEFKEREVSRLSKEIAANTNELTSKNVQQEKLLQQIQLKKDILNDIRLQIEQYENTYDSRDDKKLEELAVLLEENEIAKKRASTFKETCRQEAEIIKTQISELKEKLAEPEGPLDPSLVELHLSESEKLKKFRAELGKKTRQVEHLKRIIDDVPGRAEISQYQRRFIELYNLVRAAQHETQQFYNMYNTLTDSRNYMEKESVLLNSIYDNMEEGLASSSNLEDYLHQLDAIIGGIKENKSKLEKKQSDVKGEKTLLTEELKRLKETQLLYARMLQQFSQEISKNEHLMEKLSR